MSLANDQDLPANLHRPATEDDLELLFETMLGRPFGDLAERRRWAVSKQPLIDLIRQLRASDEFRTRMSEQIGAAAGPARVPAAIDDFRFRLPDALRQSLPAKRHVLIIGSCMTEGWPKLFELFNPAVTAERITFNNASPLPDWSAEKISGFDFQIVQLPIRSILPEALFFDRKLNDQAGWREAFTAAVERLKLNLGAALEYHRTAGLRTYLLNFAVPQQNPTGRLLPRYDLSNLVFFFEELNRALYELSADLTDVHLLDFDQIAAGIGRKYVQDDVLQHTNHGALLCNVWNDLDGQRLEAPGDIERQYGVRAAAAVQALCEEAMAAETSLQQVDAIKLVIFDLDDTLWRGIVAEADTFDPSVGEGWPLGMVEAASNLWRRGVLIAIVSKNDPSRTRAAWDRLYGSYFPLDKFVSVKIGWEAKVDSIAEILREVNLLPESVLFVDDNPVERAAVRAAFPAMRTIEAPLLEWRRILLWAPELQGGGLSAESLQRTEMIQAQIERGTVAGTMDRDAFLASLDLRVDARRVTDPAGAGFDRCLELLNKTNQFNTTGQRWSHVELASLLEQGGFLIAVAARDRFTKYGIVGVAVLDRDRIVQIVLSCRVFGMGIERAIVGLAHNSIVAGGHAETFADVIATGRNELALDLYRAAGFEQVGDSTWRSMAETPWQPPAYMSFDVEEQRDEALLA